MRLNRNRWAILSLWFITFVACAPCLADTYVNGSQEGVWTIGNSPYILSGDVTIQEGKTLSIEAGVEVQTPASTREIFVYGRLLANGTTFSGVLTELQIQDGGELTLSGCSADGVIHFYDGGNSSISGSIIKAINIQGQGIRNILNNTSIGYMNLYDQGGADLQISGNTFVAAYPFRIHSPAFDTSTITGNVYTAGDPVVLIRGTVNADHTLAGVDSLAKYELVEGSNLLINPGVSLTVDPNVEIYTSYSTSDLMIYGTLLADHASFSGNATEFHIQSGGGVNLNNSDIAGLIRFLDGGGGTIENCNIRDISLEGTGYRQIVNNTSIRHISLNGPGAPGLWISGNTFTYLIPFRLVNLWFDTSVITGNTFTDPAAYTAFRGTVSKDLVMAGIDQVLNYQIDDRQNFVIDPNTTLNVKPGVDIRSNVISDIVINGTLIARDAAFSGPSTHIQVNEFANCDVNNCRIDGQAVLLDNSNVFIDGCLTNAIYIEDPNTCKIFCSSISYVSLLGRTTGCIQGNSIHNEYPFRISVPDIDTHRICDNTLLDPDPRIRVAGRFEYNTLFGYIDGLGNYEMSGDLTISPGVMVSMPPGIFIDGTLYSYDIIVEGFLFAEDMAFVASLSELSVHQDASINLMNCTMPKSLNINEGATATLSYCICRTVNINSQATNSFLMNDFSNASVRALGNPSDVIQLGDNWWGTTDTALIADKIIDFTDDPTRPVIDFNPVLAGEPIIVPTIPGDFMGDPQVLGDDLDYFCSHWLLSCCKTGDWCEGTDLNRDGEVTFLDFSILSGNWLIPE